ncbi:MAG: glycosyltransferase family 4 protein, partial [Verrucomicrobiales bacterium]|nr:glycosyltransferase family 4 protein [Verrucomicrobiales bacterium]MCP5557780.1 glycosyltransferase family 4 protein [Verrucomicrobiaceae bacterium]
MPSVPPYHIAYIFERFPSFTQTFCVREIQELQRQGVRPLIFSIRDTRDEGIQHFPPELFEQVHFLPSKEELTAKVREWKDAHQLPRAAGLCLRHWGDLPDKARVYEAAYIAKVMADLGSAAPRHTHSHFAGIGARTCWWLRKFTGTSYSFTAHANDIFCKAGEQSPPFERLFTDASLIVTVSDYTAKQLRQQYPQAAARVQRVYNGLDLAPIIAARSRADRKESPGGILSVGRLIEKKGYEDLITACSFLRDWGLDFQCRIVGEGPLEQPLQDQIKRLHLAHNVELTGPLGMDEITHRLVSQTQVFALACATESDGGKDNLPTVLMEAMAASLPCVSTRIAGVPEMVLENRTGLLCDERQPELFAAHLAQLLKESKLCEKMGAAGLDHAREHFALEKTAKHLLTQFAEHGGLRLDIALMRRHPQLLRHWARRLPKTFSAQLRHRPTKMSSKSFDLAGFIEG